MRLRNTEVFSAFLPKFLPALPLCSGLLSFVHSDLPAVGGALLGVNERRVAQPG